MKVSVQRVFHGGVIVPAKVRAAHSPRVEGVMRITEDRHEEMGRTTFKASLLDPKSGCMELLLPPLYDAQVIFVHQDTMRVRGTETAGKQHLAQCWDIKVQGV
jgi:hypothetical protein